ncbi:hypothetical protein Gotri_008479 [Gossypium trilobum]|uniref:RNase H type-1 domain-containing protein n=1 Tax=Gossypium trilobum TaxID=34281 RepID=A0A7J9EK91_9ROSI|nr:hypothetical protein [Gossypium trilobum]
MALWKYESRWRFIETFTQASSSSTSNWIRLYFDSAVKVDSGEATAKEVLRDHHGHWIIGFNRILGQGSIFNAELWGILDGLTILHNKCWDKVSIQIDSVEVIQAIQVAFSRTSNSALIRRIQQLLSKMDQWEMPHIPREENTKVDRIVKLAFNKNDGM